ncbi:MAG: hypothetical protein ACLSWS_07225, partial [Faecalispora jeddahensis]
DSLGAAEPLQAVSNILVAIKEAQMTESFFFIITRSFLLHNAGIRKRSVWGQPDSARSIQCTGETTVILFPAKRCPPEYNKIMCGKCATADSRMVD